MELNRKQIIEALECCATDDCAGEQCPFYVDCQFCITRISKGALELIKELSQAYEMLSEENNRLMQEKTALECIVSTARNQAKADTVRKMQERLKARKFTHKNFGELVYVEDIDQIAKEMLEGADERYS